MAINFSIMGWEIYFNCLIDSVLQFQIITDSIQVTYNNFQCSGSKSERPDKMGLINANPLWMSLVIYCTISSVTALIGYDCKNAEAIFATYSLIDSGSCTQRPTAKEPSTDTIQLLQPCQTTPYQYIACSVEFRQTVVVVVVVVVVVFYSQYMTWKYN